MLPDPVLEVLACPVCSAGLASADRALRCSAGHAFDIARQGYVNLRGGGRPAGTGDTADMVAARADFLAGDHYRPIADALAHVASEASGAQLVVDVGGGTGYYLARSLDRLPTAHGIAVDVSAYALRRAARAHPRVTAVGADVWQGLPLRAACADVVLDVFAPRNSAEFHRVLRPGGTLVVVTPATAHLGELVGALGLLSVDERKDQRVEETLGTRFILDARSEVTFALSLTSDDAARLVRMGPSAHHLDAGALATRIAELGAPVEVTASVVVTSYRSR